MSFYLANSFFTATNATAKGSKNQYKMISTYATICSVLAVIIVILVIDRLNSTKRSSLVTIE
ncbi:hypothetical protein NC99_41790 [Sunxiuqinia dokdonensis]|uniref:Uncharacterized protein n=1 Tax=Sunxiuqinia dokdonensis TaxID=1409788 RepID=A0A0L8V3L3_9BACT|nr:hypothetical protein NC99_41790 [Sunxiuqinia dokdonensis]